jgi:hypothetical protein
MKVEEIYGEDSCDRPWLLNKRESEICFESLVKKIDYDNLEQMLYRS